MEQTTSKLEEVRTQRGMTRAEMARRAKVSYQSAFSYEKDEVMPSYAIMKRIAAVLDCEVEAIWGDA